MTLLTRCASLPNSSTARIDNHLTEFALTINDTTPIVFENGLGGRMEWWKEVITEFSESATTFAYNRPGYGKSDPVSTPRDGEIRYTRGITSCAINKDVGVESA